MRTLASGCEGGIAPINRHSLKNHAQGTTTTLVLSSETYLELAVKLADGFTSEAIGDRAGTVFIQSDGHFHVITCKFTEGTPAFGLPWIVVGGLCVVVRS